MKAGRLIVLASILALKAAYAQDSALLVYTRYAPANFLDEHGRPAGFYVDITREALARIGYGLAVETHPWRRCQQMVYSGLADIMITTPVPERLEYSVRVDPPVWIKRYAVFTVPGHGAIPAMDAIRTPEDLARSGLSVVSYIGNEWAQQTLATNGVALVESVSVEAMYRMLIAGRGDCIVEDVLLVTASLSEYGLPDALVKTGGVLDDSAFHLLIGKSSPLAARSGELGRVLAAMYSDGTIERIMAGYR